MRDLGLCPSSRWRGRGGEEHFAGGKKSGESVPDWVSIKTEYISTQISTRELAKKHGVSHSQVARRSAVEKWVEQRETLRNKTETLCIQKTAEAVSDLQADRITQLLSAGQKAACLLSSRLDQMADDGKIKTYEIKAITEALKNVRDLYETEGADAGAKEDDGLISALSATAEQVCNGEDDSCMLPEVDDGEEESS